MSNVNKSGRKRRWNSLYGHFSRKSAPVHASTSARARARPSTRSGRKSLKKCVFGCEGKITADGKRIINSEKTLIGSYL